MDRLIGKEKAGTGMRYGDTKADVERYRAGMSIRPVAIPHAASRYYHPGALAQSPRRAKAHFMLQDAPDNDREHDGDRIAQTG